MEVKQEPTVCLQELDDPFIEEQKVQYHEKLFPNVIVKEIGNNQKHKQISYVTKTELVSIKQENGYLQTDNLQLTSINVKNKTKQSVCMKYNFLRIRHSKQSRMALIHEKIMKQTDRSTGIIICSICGNAYTKKMEFVWHFSTIHCFQQKKICKIDIKEKYIINIQNQLKDTTVTDPNEDVKRDIQIVKMELKDEVLESRNRTKGTDNFNQGAYVRNARHCYDYSQNFFKCKICLKSFGHKSDLMAHFRSHAGEKPFKCNICIKSFSQKNTLNVHLRCHTGEKPFKCDTCSKSFSAKTNLNVHKRCHTGEKPFKCKFCFKSFSQKDALNIHVRCHTGEKPFKCDICSKSFTRKNCLKTHVHCHTDEKPFKCEICLKSFTRKGSLGTHMRCHTGEKPFKCEICLKGFRQKWDFKKHMKIHTGEKPFKCEICMKSFIGKSDLNRHLLALSHQRKTIQM